MLFLKFLGISLRILYFSSFFSLKINNESENGILKKSVQMLVKTDGNQPLLILKSYTKMKLQACRTSSLKAVGFGL